MVTAIKTIQEAYQFVRKVKVCTIFESEKCKHTSLWENVDLPEKQPGEKGWGQKVSAVWSWKNELPAIYPEDIYYGKIKGGFAVLMDMDYLRETHFESAYRPVEKLPRLQRDVYDKIRLQPRDTTNLRREAISEFGCTKGQFDTALKNLQISLNIVRSNDPDLDHDVWLPFRELYFDIWQARTVAGSDPASRATL